MGLTRIGALRFYWVSQVGMLLGTMVYVYAGTQFGQFRVLRRRLLVAFGADRTAAARGQAGARRAEGATGLREVEAPGRL